jgi:hypothetical protein
MSDINRQVRNYSTCVCFVFLVFLSEMYKLRFQSGGIVKSIPTLSKKYISCNAVPVAELNISNFPDSYI